MSLDFYLHERWRRVSDGGEEDRQVFSRNITHNLGRMFEEAGVYEILWHGDGKVAGAVLPALKVALDSMLEDPPRFRKHDSPNGWGIYPHALEFLRDVIAGCEDHPSAIIRCSI